jgi:DNA-binding PadR family transcriptional regulator
VTRRGDTLELAVLGLLHETPMHGYELRKRLNLVLGWGRVLSYGSLYPALKKMLRAGWISEHVAASPTPVAKPAKAAKTVKATKPTKATAPSRRQRIVYELTPSGNERFARLLSDAGPAAWEDGDFDVRFAFFGRTDREIRLRILEGRRTRLEERLARVEQQLLRLRADDTYAAELQRHGLESVQREVTWLSGLIAAERNEAAGGTPTSTTSESA